MTITGVCVCRCVCVCVCVCECRCVGEGGGGGEDVNASKAMSTAVSRCCGVLCMCTLTQSICQQIYCKQIPHPLKNSTKHTKPHKPIQTMQIHHIKRPGSRASSRGRTCWDTGLTWQHNVAEGSVVPSCKCGQYHLYPLMICFHRDVGGLIGMICF